MIYSIISIFIHVYLSHYIRATAAGRLGGGNTRQAARPRQGWACVAWWCALRRCRRGWHNGCAGLTCVHIWICVCIRIHMYIWICVCIRIHMYMWICVHMCTVCIYICMHCVLIFVDRYTWFLLLYGCAGLICVYLWIYVHWNTNIYIYIYMYT